MIGNSIPELVFIRLSILLLRLVPYLSLVFLSIVVLDFLDVLRFSFPGVPHGQLSWIWVLAVTYASLEVLFWLIFLRRLRRIQAPPTYVPLSTTREERREIFKGCCLDPIFSTLDPQYPEGWFFPNKRTTSTPSGDSRNSMRGRLKKQDVVEWVNSVFLLTNGGAEDEEEMKEYLEWIETRLDIKLEEDDNKVPVGEGPSRRDWWSLKRRTKEIRSMRVTQDPITALHRPFLWYLIVLLVDTLTSLNLFLHGFRHFTLSSNWFSCFPPRPVLALPGMSTNTKLMQLDSRDKEREVLLPYWYREHRAGKDRLPVVFFHGIGIGLHPYTPFLNSLPSNVGVIAFELLPISMHMTHSPLPPRPLMIQAVERILNSVGWERVVVVGHSYGTFLLGGLAKQMNWPSGTGVQLEAPTIQESQSTASASTTATRSTDVDDETEEAGLLPSSFTSDSSSHGVPLQELYPYSTLYPPSLSSTHLSLRRRIFHVILVDPIPILLHLPTIAYNFLYRYPDPYKAAQWQLWYFASRDADVGRQLGRGMFWKEGWLDKKALSALARREGEGTEDGLSDARPRKGKNIAVVLAGEDQIVPADAVRTYLTGEDSLHEDCWREEGWGWKHQDGESGGTGTGPLVNLDLEPSPDPEIHADETLAGNRNQHNLYADLDVIYTPHIDHASIFDTKQGTERICEVVDRYCRAI